METKIKRLEGAVKALVSSWGSPSSSLREEARLALHDFMTEVKPILKWAPALVTFVERVAKMSYTEQAADIIDDARVLNRQMKTDSPEKTAP